MVFYFKGGMQAKGIWKQDYELNIWAHNGSTMRNFIVCTIHLIYSVKLKKIKSVAYSSQGSHAGQLEFRNWLADGSTMGLCD